MSVCFARSEPSRYKPTLQGEYHSGKDIHFAIDSQGNIRNFNPSVNRPGKMIATPVGYIRFREGATFIEFQTIHIATRQESEWTTVKLRALAWLGDRVREQRYGKK